MRQGWKKKALYVLSAFAVVSVFNEPVNVKAVDYETTVGLENVYDDYGSIGDGYWFADYEKKEGEEYLKELVLVSNTKEKHYANVSGYKSVLSRNARYGGCVCLVKENGEKVLYFQDGTTFPKTGEAYTDITVLPDGNFIVFNKNSCDIIDKNSNIIKEDVFEVKKHGDVSYSINLEINGYTVLKQDVYDENGESSQLKIFDKEYKAVKEIDIEGKKVICTKNSYMPGFDPESGKGLYLAVYDENGIDIYDKEMKKIEFSYKKAGVVENPSPTMDNIEVLTGCYIESANWGYDYIKEQVYLFMSMKCEYTAYENGIGSTNLKYENAYYDVENNKELDEKDVSDIYDENKENASDILYTTDISLKWQNYTWYYYENEKVLFTCDDLREYMKKTTGEENDLFYYEQSVGCEGDIYVSLRNFTKDIYYLMKIEKDTGYDYTKSEIIKQKLEVAYDEFEGILICSDACYFDGKWYDGYDGMQLFYLYDKETDSVGLSAYRLKEKTENKYEYVMYDKAKNEIIRLTEDISEYDELSGMMITCDKEDKFGCIFMEKLLTTDTEILDEIKTAKSGKIISIKADKNVGLKKSVLEALKGKDITLTVKVNDDFCWMINGKKITDENLTDVNLWIEISTDKELKEACERLKIQGEKICFSIMHDGEFGFEAELSIKLKEENRGKYANLFYYNEKTGQLEKMDSVMVSDEGIAKFKYKHASEYVILLTDAAYDEIPDTKDVVNVMYMISLMLLVSFAFITLKSKINI